MSTWIDYGIVGSIVVVGLIIMYRALKEPMDLLFGGIAKMFGWGRDKIVDMGESGSKGYDVISYG